LMALLLVFSTKVMAGGGVTPEDIKKAEVQLTGEVVSLKTLWMYDGEVVSEEAIEKVAKQRSRLIDSLVEISAEEVETDPVMRKKHDDIQKKLELLHDSKEGVWLTDALCYVWVTVQVGGVKKGKLDSKQVHLAWETSYFDMCPHAPTLKEGRKARVVLFKGWDETFPMVNSTFFKMGKLGK